MVDRSSKRQKGNRRRRSPIRGRPWQGELTWQASRTRAGRVEQGVFAPSISTAGHRARAWTPCSSSLSSRRRPARLVVLS